MKLIITFYQIKEDLDRKNYYSNCSDNIIKQWQWDVSDQILIDNIRNLWNLSNFFLISAMF